MTENPLRPTLSRSDSELEAAVEKLIGSLQDGFDNGSADQYDAMFAADIFWGTPKGQWLAGYSGLNAAHRSMMHGTPIEPASRFELAQASSPAPGVVVAQVRRSALNGGFSEVAMYVLVKHDERWWLAAAQNTPVSDSLQPANPTAAG